LVVWELVTSITNNSDVHHGTEISVELKFGLFEIEDCKPSHNWWLARILDALGFGVAVFVGF
jgi:hypothetical protein